MSARFDAVALAAVGLLPFPLDAQGVPLAGWREEQDFSPAPVEARFTDELAAGLALRCDGLAALRVGPKAAATWERQEQVNGKLPATVVVEGPEGERYYLLRSEGAALASRSDLLDTGLSLLHGPAELVTVARVVSQAGQELAIIPPAWLQALLRALAEPLPPPGEELDLAQPRTDTERADARESALARLRQSRVPDPGRGRDAALLAGAELAVRGCLTEDDALDAFREWLTEYGNPDHPVTEDASWAKVQAALRENALGSDFRAPVLPGTPEPSRLVCWVKELGCYLTLTRDRRTWDLAHPLDQRAALGVLVNAGMRPDDAARALKEWSVGYAQAVDCEPEKAPLFRDEYGNLTVNTYVPPALAPKAGKWPTIRYLIDYLCKHDPGAEEWLLNWLAAARRFPGRRLKTAPVLVGTQGSGKSVLLTLAHHLLGEANSYSISNEDLEGRFNAHFASKLLLTVEEVRNRESRDFMPKLKALTGAPRLSMEAKGSTACQVTNRIKLMAASNDTQALQVEQGDTRFVMLENFASVTEAHRKQLSNLFTGRSSGVLSVAGQAELAAFAWDLDQREVDFEAADTAFDNEARQAVIEASKGSVQQFCDAVEQATIDSVFEEVVPKWEQDQAVYKDGLDLPRPGHVGHGALYGIYMAFCKARGLRPCGSAKLAMELKRWRPAWTPDRPNIVWPDGSRTRVSTYSGIPRNPLAWRATPELASSEGALAAMGAVADDFPFGIRKEAQA